MTDLLTRILEYPGQNRCIKNARTLEEVMVPYDLMGHPGTQLLLPFVLEEELPTGGSAKATIHVFTPLGVTWTYEATVFDDFRIGFYGSKGAKGVVFKYYNGLRRRPGAHADLHPVDPKFFRHAIVNMQCGTAPAPETSPGEIQAGL